MNDSEVLQLISEALVSVAPDREDQFQRLNLDSRVRELGIDSIATLEMVGAIEDRLARTFDEQELAKVHRLRDIAALIRSGRVGSP